MSSENVYAAYVRQKKRAADARRVLRKIEEAHRSGNDDETARLIVGWRAELDRFGSGRYDEKEGHDG